MLSIENKILGGLKLYFGVSSYLIIQYLNIRIFVLFSTWEIILNYNLKYRKFDSLKWPMGVISLSLLIS